jgi:hypothetical protein
VGVPKGRGRIPIDRSPRDLPALNGRYDFRNWLIRAA